MDTPAVDPLDEILMSGQPSGTTTPPAPTSEEHDPLDDILLSASQKPKAVDPVSAAAPPKSKTQVAYESKFDPNITFGGMSKQAYDNFVPSVKNLGAGVLSSFIHPIDTASGLFHLVQGVASKIDEAAGRHQDPEEKAKTEAPLNALMTEYHDKFKDLPHFMNYFAQDPAGVLMDLSTIATGGEMAASKVGQLTGKLGEIAGKAGEAVSGLGAPGRAISTGSQAVKSGLQSTGSAIKTGAEVVGKVGENINPLNPLGVFTPEKSILPIGKNALDENGNFTSKADDLIKSTTNGLLGAEHFDDPVAKSIMADTLNKKGFTPEAVKEGILRSAAPEMQAPTSVITGKASPAAAQAVIDNAVIGNNERIANAARSIISPKNGMSLGADLEQALVNSHNNYRSLYDKIKNTDGDFAYFGPIELRDKIQENLSKSGVLNDLSLLDRNTSLPQTKLAIKNLNDVILNGNTKTNLAGNITAQELTNLRKELGSIRNEARGSDIKGVSDIIDALDSHAEDMANQGYFVDSNGLSNKAIAKDLANAINAYRQHKQSFAEPNLRNNSIVNASKMLESGLSRDAATGDYIASGDIDLHRRAEAQILKDLTSPAKGADTYNQLESVLGSIPPDSIQNYLKSAAAPIENGKLNSSPSVVQLVTDPNSSVAKALANDPQSLNSLRRLHAANMINNMKPIGKSASMLKGIVGSAASKLGLQAVGSVVGGLPGYVAGTVLEHGAEAIGSYRKQLKALEGAPIKKGALAKASKYAETLSRPSIVNAARAIAISNLAQGTPQQGAYNAGNIRKGSKEEGFKTYETPEQAVKAVIENAQAYPSAFNNGKDMTLRQIASHWAPYGDGKNDPNVWANNVGKLAGIDPDKPINLQNKSLLPNLAKAIHIQERGRQDLYSDDVYHRAVGAATDGRIERASGGKVDHVDRLVNKLINQVKVAKKVTDQTTEPLLNAPDEAIVKALSAANQAI